MASRLPEGSTWRRPLMAATDGRAAEAADIFKGMGSQACRPHAHARSHNRNQRQPHQGSSRARRVCVGVLREGRCFAVRRAGRCPTALKQAQPSPSLPPVTRSRRTAPNCLIHEHQILKTGDGVQPRPWVRIPPRRLPPPTAWLSGLRGVESDSRQEPPRTTGQHIGRARGADRRFSRSAASRARSAPDAARGPAPAASRVRGPRRRCRPGRGRGRTGTRPMYRRTPSIPAGPCGRARPRSRHACPAGP